MVPGQRKFCLFFCNLEIGEGVLHREFIAEAQAVVVEPEADVHDGAGFLPEADQQLIIVVSDL